MPYVLRSGSPDSIMSTIMGAMTMITSTVTVYPNILIFHLPFVIDKKDVDFYDILYFLLIIVFEPLVEFVEVDDG